MRPFLPFLLLVVATSLETGGDAIIRLGLMTRALALRAGLMLAGAAGLGGGWSARMSRRSLCLSRP